MPEGWKEFEEQAKCVLTHSEELGFPDPPLIRFAALRLWEHPSFGNYTSWTLLQARTELPPIVRRVVWDRSADGERWANPITEVQQRILKMPPSIRFADAVLSISEVHALLERGSALQIPIFRNIGSTMLDGVTYGLEVSHGPIRIQWGPCEGPAEWSSVTAWAREFRELFEQHFPSP